MSDVTLGDMDAMVSAIRTKRAEYDLKKEESTKAYNELQALEDKLLAVMTEQERDSYLTGDGVRVTVKHAMSVTTPKTVDERRAFFKWLAETKGQDVADAYMTINSQSLNSLYKMLTEEAAGRGELLTVPGLSEPVARTSLSIRVS